MFFTLLFFVHTHQIDSKNDHSNAGIIDHNGPPRVPVGWSVAAGVGTATMSKSESKVAPVTEASIALTAFTSAPATRKTPVLLTTPHTIQLQQPNFKLEKIMQKCNVTAEDRIFTHLDGTRYLVVKTYVPISTKVLDEKIDVMCLPGAEFDFAEHPDVSYVLLDCYSCVKQEIKVIGILSSGAIASGFEISGFVLGVIGALFTIMTGILALYRHLRRRRLTKSSVPRNSPQADDLTDIDSVEEVAN